jgi:hypothetical protein
LYQSPLFIGKGTVFAESDAEKRDNSMVATVKPTALLDLE